MDIHGEPWISMVNHGDPFPRPPFLSFLTPLSHPPSPSLPGWGGAHTTAKVDSRKKNRKTEGFFHAAESGGFLSAWCLKSLIGTLR